MKYLFLLLSIMPFSAKTQDCIERIVVWDALSLGVRPNSFDKSAPIFLWDSLSTKNISGFIKINGKYTPITQHINKRENKVRLKSALIKDNQKLIATIIIKKRKKHESERKNQKRCKKKQIIMTDLPSFYFLFEQEKRTFP